MTFSDKLQKLRRREGLSQEALAEALGVTRQAVSKWETGESIPDAARLIALSERFAVSIDILLKDDLPLETPSANAAPAVMVPAETVLPAPQQPQGPPQEAKENRRARTAIITGSILSGIGALGFVVLWVLSTMLPAYIQYTGPTEEDPVTGNMYQGAWEMVVYELPAFVSCYRLEAICWILGVMLITGIIVLLWGLWKRHPNYLKTGEW